MSVISDLQKSCRNSTKDSCTCITQISWVLTLSMLRKVLLFQKVRILFSTLCAHLSFLRWKLILVHSQWSSMIPFNVIKYAVYRSSSLSHKWLFTVKFVWVRIQTRSPCCIWLAEYIYFYQIMSLHSEWRVLIFLVWHGCFPSDANLN